METELRISIDIFGKNIFFLETIRKTKHLREEAERFSFFFFSVLPFQRGERKQREENRDEKRWQRGEAMLIPRSELGDSKRFPTFYGFPLLDSTAATRLSTVGDDNDFVSNNSSPLD